MIVNSETSHDKIYGTHLIIIKKDQTRLAIDICVNNRRPNFELGTPEVYINLAILCMNANANERPSAKELLKSLETWTKYEEFKEIFKAADKDFDIIMTDSEFLSNTYTDVRYTSQLINIIGMYY
ncbi:12746_t:CDS:2 [Cetraspora pellucida]|uniref:12746_t:CDS:1 n=1 Tax=Cetraspora pellucida TaxID=1433469 RepID=A0A9N9EG77_9GLOM|nr:12746_t:CDS:2 [Cetraspora pellucida]